MLIAGLQRLTLLDFPQRVACTLFAHGCNLRCPFCHNASLVIKQPENNISKEFLSDFLLKRKDVLDGVCLTGGEPLMQRDVLKFLEYLKGFGYKIKLDTNGCFPEKLKEILKNRLADYIAMDIKSSKANYSLATGVEIDLSPIEKSVDLIMASGVDYEFRTTAVNGIHTAKNFEDIANWISGTKKYFIQQFSPLGDLISNEFSAFSKAEMQNFLNIVKPKIPNAELRGI